MVVFSCVARCGIKKILPLSSLNDEVWRMVNHTMRKSIKEKV
jgi:hypothetical protein